MSDAQNTNDELYPIAVLIDELKVRPSPPCFDDDPDHHLDHLRQLPVQC